MIESKKKQEVLTATTMGPASLSARCSRGRRRDFDCKGSAETEKVHPLVSVSPMTSSLSSVRSARKESQQQ